MVKSSEHRVRVVFFLGWMHISIRNITLIELPSYNKDLIIKSLNETDECVCAVMSGDVCGGYSCVSFQQFPF